MINLTTEEQRATGQRISGADLDDARPDEPSDDGEDGEHDEQALEVYKHKDKQTTAAGKGLDTKETALVDYKELHFDRDFVDVDGEHIHATEYFGTKWTERSVSLACASSHIPGYLVLTYT
jgi:hypothetical protein